MRRSIRGMVVVITGASAGIGRALAIELNARGAKLILAARRLDRLNALNRDLGGTHLVVQADVAHQEDCVRLIHAAAERFGRIDTLVCNAGYGDYTHAWEVERHEVEAIFATNFFGTLDPIRAARPILLKNDFRDGYRGQIMIVSSCVARRGTPFLGVYSATKAAQLTFAESLRVELRDTKIAVTTVHPIMTETEFGKAASAGGLRRNVKDESFGKQSPAHVARRMADAIERPTPEVWPSRPSRLFFSLATYLPRLTDLAMARFARSFTDRRSA